MLPALIVLGAGLPPTTSLVISQVVLSFGIPFALVPLVALTRRADVMGALVNRRPTTLAAAGAAALIIGLNVYLLASALERPQSQSHRPAASEPESLAGL